jgi:hypothetical protein
MLRVEKTAKISDALELMLSKFAGTRLYIITEGWCGDAAQLVPFFTKLAKAAGIDAYIALRDQNLHLMDLFLTNGTSRSIPIVICIDASTLTYLWHWGPRPLAAQILLDKFKVDNVDMHVQKTELHKWYAQNKLQDVQQEILTILSAQ